MAQPLERIYRGCSSIKEYDLQEKLGEGTFGEVYKGVRRKSSAVSALKKILMHNEKDGFPITALREIKLLKTLSHINVIKLEEMAVERSKTGPRAKAVLYMVFPYMEHDLSGLLDNPSIRITVPQIKCYMQQLLRGLKYLHQSRILHRDMKAANLLINNRGILQIADFGLARHYDGETPDAGVYPNRATRDYTSLVVTRWYRPPELLLNLRRYTTAIDIWGAGCVFGEMFKRKPILTGQSDLHQAQIIFELLGSPNEKRMPSYWKELPGAQPVASFDSTNGNIDRVFNELTPDALDLLKQLLNLNWEQRVHAVDALDHPYFKNHPLPARPEEIPRFADSHELDRRNHRGAKQHLPPAPQGGTVGGGANGDWANADRIEDWARNRDAYPPQGNQMSRRVPPGANDGNRRRAWQPPGDTSNGQARSSLPPPPGEGSRHPLPANPINPHRPNHSKKDTYIPTYNDGGNRRDETFSRNSRDRSRSPDHRSDDRRRDRSRDSVTRRRPDRDDYGNRYRRDRSADSNYRDSGRRRDHRDRDGPPGGGGGRDRGGYSRDDGDRDRKRVTRSRSPGEYHDPDRPRDHAYPRGRGGDRDREYR